MRRVRNSFVVLLLLVATSFAELDWWEGGNFYQIYPRSFKDSNGDGIGDLLGIASKVGYLKELGMDGVWLSPIMKSPQADYGYDISDYRDIHWEYGSLQDFDTLLAECKKYNVKLILDLVPNHSSNEHEWFIKSENREPGYENYYIWHPGKFDPITGQRKPPNNWVLSSKTKPCNLGCNEFIIGQRLPIPCMDMVTETKTIFHARVFISAT